MPGQTRDQRLQQDLDFTATELPRRHGNAFHSISRADFDAAASALRDSIPQLSDTRFYTRLSALVALIGDAHTTLGLEGANAAAVGFRKFPIVFQWLDDGVFVTSAAGEYKRAVAAQLVRVGAYPVSEAVTRLATVISHENDYWLHYYAARYLSSQQILQALDLLPGGDSSSLTFRDASGEEFTLDVITQTQFDYVNALYGSYTQPYLTRRNENYWTALYPERRLLYLRYNRCANDPARPFDAVAASMWNEFDKGTVDSIVVDLRDNGGGDSTVLNPFLFGLLPRLQAIAARPQFRVFGIIDQGTFSSAMLNASFFKYPSPKAVDDSLPDVDLSKILRLVGEPTGGALASWGEVLTLSLPQSRLGLQYATKYFDQPPFLTDSETVTPDIRTPLRSTDFFAGHDPAMASIFARSAPPAPPSGDLLVWNSASLRPEQGITPDSMAAALGAFGDNPVVTVNGTAAAVVVSSPSLVVFVVPPDTVPGRAVARIQSGDQAWNGSFTVTPDGPGLLIASNPPDVAQPSLAVNEDGLPNSQTNPARRGTIVTLFATGYGQSGGKPLAISGTQQLEAVMSTPAGSPGLWTLSVRIPTASTFSGRVPVFAAAGGFVSTGVTLWVEP